jgi:uncharacterized phage-associated protein
MDKIQLLNDSRMARIVYEQFSQYIQKKRAELLARVLAETRAGPVDPQIYAKFLGGIDALDDLDSVIKKSVLKGEKIERELLDAARKPE